MLDSFVYEDHHGRRFVGLENGVYLNANDLRDYSWSYETINDRISRFYRPVKSRKIPLVVSCNSDSEAVTVKNRLLEFAETDISVIIPGKIFVGDYYTNGYITASAKGNYMITKRLCEIDLTLTSDNPAWYKETKHTFVSGESSTVGVGEGTDYPYDYQYDYALSMTGKRIASDAVGGSAFRLLIYGEVTDPVVVIGGHVYSVNGQVKAGEMLLIDSLSKTITLTTALGNKINWFDKRNRESYIFEPIPAGMQSVNWSGNFGFDLTVIEERSEPRWT